jgi:outer membrane biosynthesis protein TonB
MVFVPIRGIFLLGRTAFIIAAAAAVPVLLKKNRKLADQVGSTLIKAGEKLKQEYGGAEAKEANFAPAEAKKAQTTKASPAPKPVDKTSPKKPPAKKPSEKAATKRAPARPRKKASKPPAG